MNIKEKVVIEKSERKFAEEETSDQTRLLLKEVFITRL